MVMAPMCAGCLREMYDCRRIDPPFDDFEQFPLGGLTRRGRAAFKATWAWQSDWTPSLCRECDRAHDHRESPSLWFRFKRWLRHKW